MAPPSTIPRRSLYIGLNDGSLRAIDVSSGNTRWELPTHGEVFASPTLSADGTV